MKLTLVIAWCVAAAVLLSSCGRGTQAVENQTPMLTSAARMATTTPTAARQGTPTPTPVPGSFDAMYAALREQAGQANPNSDFTALRMAFVETDEYDPYNFAAGELKLQMNAALEAKDYELAYEVSGQMLDQGRLSPDAHLGALFALEGLKQPEEAEFHRYVLDGLVGSILNSGDGRSAETAYVVVLIEEEYLILGALRIGDVAQSTIEENGHSYDVFDGLDGITNGPVTVYFNIDIPFQWLAGSMTP